MFKRILVPLDGTTRAEVIMPYVIEIARAFSSEILLLHIESPTYQPPSGISSPMVGGPPTPGPPIIVPNQSVSSSVLQYDYDNARTERMRAYLDRVASDVQSQGIKCQAKIVLEPDAGEYIAKLSHSGDVDLVALTTEAPTEWEKFIYGSIPDHVVRVTNIPLLLVRVSHATC